MKIATLFHRASGTVLGRVGAPDNGDFAVYETAETGVYPGEVDAETQYIVPGSPLTVGTRMPVVLTLPATLTLGSTLTINGLPNPCWAMVGGTIQQLTGGSAVFTPQETRWYTFALVGPHAGTWTVRVIEAVEESLAADPRWQALLAATPTQIDTWLANNVTTLAQARQVLKVLLLAVRKLGA